MREEFAPARLPLEMRTFDKKDFAHLIAWAPTADALSDWCAAFFNHPLDVDQLQNYLDSAKTPLAREIFTVMEIDKSVAHVELSMIWPHLSCRLSRVLVEHYRVDRIDLGVADNNAEAIRLYEKEGFVQVGLWPDAIPKGTRAINVVWMTVSRARWARS